MGITQACNYFHEHLLNVPGFWIFQQNPGVPSSLLAFRRLDGTPSPPWLASYSADHHRSSGPSCCQGNPSLPGCFWCPEKELVAGRRVLPRLPAGDCGRCPGQAAMLSPSFISLGRGSVPHGPLDGQGFSSRWTVSAMGSGGEHKGKTSSFSICQKKQPPQNKQPSPLWTDHRDVMNLRALVRVSQKQVEKKQSCEGGKSLTKTKTVFCAAQRKPSWKPWPRSCPEQERRPDPSVQVLHSGLILKKGMKP